MTESKSYIPSGWPPVIPRLSVSEPKEMVHFLKDVFLAEGEYNADRPSELKIGESLIIVAGILERMPTTSFLYIYVEDVDTSYQKALTLGAVTIEEPAEMPYGDRRAMIKDNWGNHWQIATHRGFPDAP